jgi:hypothetical protein
VSGVSAGGDIDSLEGTAPEFDVVAFMEREQVALWLFRYDRVAWQTTDLVMQEPPEVLERLTPIWFCMEHKGAWHALYGQFDTEKDEYRTMLHYAETSKGFKRSKKALPQAEVNSLARALHALETRSRELLGGKGVKFNTYVRRLDSEKIEVWTLPAWQEDGQLAFGAEYRAVVDGEGRGVLEDTPPTGILRKGTPSLESDWIIPNEESDVPSVGDIFTTMLVHRSVARAGIRNREYLSAYVDISGAGAYRWVHVHRDHDVDTAIEAMRRLHAEGRLREGGEDDE